MPSEISSADLLTAGVALFCFFGAQLVAVWVWSKKEQREREEREDARRREQLVEMRRMLDSDISKLDADVDALRLDLQQSDHRHKQGREQMHGHLRRIEESRPTRQEMEKELGQMRDTIITVKKDLQAEIRTGFDTVGKRFDEFKEYARDLWKPR